MTGRLRWLPLSLIATRWNSCHPEPRVCGRTSVGQRWQWRRTQTEIWAPTIFNGGRSPASWLPRGPFGDGKCTANWAKAAFMESRAAERVNSQTGRSDRPQGSASVSDIHLRFVRFPLEVPNSGLSATGPEAVCQLGSKADIPPAKI